MHRFGTPGNWEIFILHPGERELLIRRLILSQRKVLWYHRGDKHVRTVVQGERDDVLINGKYAIIYRK